jgi:hypothetical protein
MRWAGNEPPTQDHLRHVGKFIPLPDSEWLPYVLSTIAN